MLCGTALHAQAEEETGSDADQPIVRDIRFRGLQQYRPSVLESKMKTEEGAPFNKQNLQEDIRRLYRAGYVKRIRWNLEEMEDGVRLVLQVAENPRLERVKLEGVTVFTENKLRQDIKIIGAERMNDYLINRDKQKLKEKYRKKGYHFVEINERRLEGDEGKILVLEVVEGPQVAVEEITIHGAEVFVPDTLIDLMDSEPGWLFGSTNYRKKTLKKDVKKLNQYYRRNGYLDARVRIREIRFSEGKEYVYITLDVEEGPQYNIESVEFKGNTLFSRDQLLKQLRLRPDEPMQLRKMAQDRRAIRTLYGKKAYIDTEVDWTYEVIPDSNRVHLVIQITEHGTTTAGRIEIEGNTKTKDHVIRRQITVEPGQPIDLRKLRESRQQLRSTRYFSKIEQERTPTDTPGVDDLTFKVEETSTGRIQFGGGFSSNAGIVGLFKISQKNFDIGNVPDSFSEIIDGTGFAGGGQTLNITLRPGVEQSRYSVSFREPFLYDQPVGLNLRGSLTGREFDDFNENRTIAEVGLDYREGDWTYSSSFEFENIEISNVDRGSPADIRNIVGDFDLYSVVPGVRLDKRNRSIIPSSGYLFDTKFRQTVGDFTFGKWTGNFNKYFPLYSTPTQGTHILSLSTQLGYARSYDSDKDVPSFDRFFAGGSKSIRGFDYRTVSPKVRDVEVGGNAKWIASAEYTFPLIRDRVRGRWQDFIRGALFVDTGTVVPDYTDINKKIRSSVGFGFRIQVPGMGPVPFSLDFGFPLSQEEEDDLQVVSFDIQTGF